MNTKTTIPITEARSKIFELTREVQKPGNYFTLTENGRPTAVLMSAEEYESWIETMEVMKDFPDLERDVQEVKRDIKSGAWRNYATLEEVMKKYQVTDTSKKSYGVSRKASAKRGKRSRQAR